MPIILKGNFVHFHANTKIAVSHMRVQCVTYSAFNLNDEQSRKCIDIATGSLTKKERKKTTTTPKCKFIIYNKTKQSNCFD